MATQVVERWNGTQVRLTGIPLPELPARMGWAAQEALTAAILYWRKRYAPGHFTVRAYDKYGHEPGLYEERAKSKRTQVHGGRVRPLYRSGNLRRGFLFGAVRVKATGRKGSLKATAVWNGLPRYTYYHRPVDRKLKHDKVAELTVTTREEEADLAKVFTRELQKILNAASM